MYALPSLEVVTPSALAGHAHSSVPRSILLHAFRPDQAELHLLVGLGDGSLSISTLALHKPAHAPRPSPARMCAKLLSRALTLALVLPLLYVLPNGFIYAMTGQGVSVHCILGVARVLMRA